MHEDCSASRLQELSSSGAKGYHIDTWLKFQQCCSSNNDKKKTKKILSDQDQTGFDCLLWILQAQLACLRSEGSWIFFSMKRSCWFNRGCVAGAWRYDGPFACSAELCDCTATPCRRSGPAMCPASKGSQRLRGCHETKLCIYMNIRVIEYNRMESIVSKYYHNTSTLHIWYFSM